MKVAIEKVLKTDTLELLAQKLLEYQNKENTRLPVLQAGLKDISKRINNIVSAIEQGIFTPATKQRLDELEEQRKELEASILQEQIAKQMCIRDSADGDVNQRDQAGDDNADPNGHTRKAVEQDTDGSPFCSNVQQLAADTGDGNQQLSSAVIAVSYTHLICTF